MIDTYLMGAWIACLLLVIFRLPNAYPQGTMKLWEISLALMLAPVISFLFLWDRLCEVAQYDIKMPWGNKDKVK